jgi:hypothetical protein
MMRVWQPLDATRAVETIEHGGRRGFDGLKEKQGRMRPEPGGVVVGQPGGACRMDACRRPIDGAA